MSYAEKLETFGELATTGRELGDEYYYWDTSDPDNLRIATDFFEKELWFLSKRDREDLLMIWHRAIEDCRDTKLLLNAIKVLQDKYEEPSFQSYYSTTFPNEGKCDTPKKDRQIE